MTTRYVNVGVKLPFQMVDELDQLAIKKLTNRSQILRNIISASLHNEKQIETRSVAFNASMMTDEEITEQLLRMKSVFDQCKEQGDK